MRKRSSYRPRPSLQDPVGWVLNGFRPVSQTGPILACRIKNHDALTSAATGSASEADVGTLLAALNVAAAIAGLGIGTEYWAEIKSASLALGRMSQRSRLVFTGPELTAMNLAMDVHDAQLADSRTTVAVLEAAMDVVTRSQKNKNQQLQAA